MANIYKNNYFKDIFGLNVPLQFSLNTLNNFNLIKYDKSAIPRIGLDSNNPKKIQELLYYSPSIENKETDDFQKNEENNFNIEIQIENKGKENKIIDFPNNKNINNTNLELKKVLDENENVSIVNSYFNINKDLQNELSIFEDINEPIPPKNIISIFKNSHHIKNNFQKINNIISNNIYSISDYHNTLLHETNNINNDKQIFNFYFNIFINNFPPNKKITPKNPCSSDNSEKQILKPLFSISSESANLKSGKLLKRGRKGLNTNNNGRTHSGSDDDNLLRKIQVHFLSFIINYINDVIKTFINNRNPPLFKNLDYSIKKRVNHQFVEKLKSYNISQILQMAVSPKMKIHDETVNKKIYWKVCNICPFMYIFLERNFQSLFKEYYYNKNKIFEVNGKVIQLSLKTKTFDDLLQKYESDKDKLKYIANKYFLSSHIIKKNK